MRNISVAISSVLVAVSVAGCVVQPEEEGVLDESAEPSQGSRAEPDGRAVPEAPRAAEPPLDGRSAAAAAAARSGVSAVLSASGAAWSSDPIPVGATQHWYWNNASPTAAYTVGLEPTGIFCGFDVTRTWDVQKPDGEREFHFEIKNTGSGECGTYIMLRSQQRSYTWGTGAIAPGASTIWYWNNANPLTAVYFVGLSPRGASASAACELEVTRTWYLQRSTQEREFYFMIKNIGGIACEADVQLAVATSSYDSQETETLAPGSSATYGWSFMLNHTVYVTGLSPKGASGTDTCRLEVVSQSYWQPLSLHGIMFGYATVKNVGLYPCSGTLLVNALY